MNCEKCNGIILKGQNFCPQCGTLVNRTEKRMCSDCNNPLEEDEELCLQCEHEKRTEKESDSEKDFAKSKNNKSVRKILIFCIVVILVVTSIILYTCINDTVEEKLTKSRWWDEEMYTHELVEYGRRYVDFWYSCHTFCPSGALRTEHFKEKRRVYSSNENYTKEVISFNRIDSFSKDNSWELLDDNRLYYKGRYYEWGKSESKSTWYVDDKELRIGESDHFYTQPTVSIYESSDNTYVIPYWCSYCGEKGPYNGVCPECGGKEKSKCYW